MVEDLLEQFKDGYYDLNIFFWPPDSKSEVIEWLGDSYDFIPQEGDDLGERMYNAFKWGFKHGYKRVIIIGSDIPTLRNSDIVKAFSGMDSYDVILGPCDDGGYYLIALKELNEKIFKDIPWSTELVLNKTTKIIQDQGKTIFFLPQKNDIDFYSDVVKLCNEITDLKDREHYPKRTLNALIQIDKCREFIKDG